MQIPIFYQRNKFSNVTDYPNKLGVVTMMISALIISVCELVLYTYLVHFGLALCIGYLPEAQLPTFVQLFGLFLSIKLSIYIIRGGPIYTVNLK